MSLTKLVKTSCVAIFLMVTSLQSFAQPSANFNAAPTEGCAPLVVTFSDQSSGNPTSWRWDLGNGTVSFLRNPSVIYHNPGQYTVKLLVTNASGSDSVVRTNMISVFAKPTVNFSASSISGCAPMNVNFTDQSIPGSGTLNSWQWDFGDGTFSTTQNPSHIYTATGSYNLSLLVTNIHGCVNTITNPNYITITDKPTAAFTNSSTANCGAPLTINFNNQSTGVGNLSYLWSFGDGQTSTEANPSHTYTTTGTFSLQLIVYNQNGCTDTIRRPSAFTIANNITGFTAPATACANSAISITNSTTPAPISQTWDFGDGTTSSSYNPSKTYTTAGTYTIKLINNFGACMDSITRTITINPQPVAGFNASPLSACYAPLTVNFTNTSTGAVSYLWDFGDGQTSTQANPSHIYTSQGSYTVTLTTTNANGCTNVKTMNQYVVIQFPMISVNQLPQRGCAPFTWTFVHNVIGGDTIVSYNWDFGDGTSSNEQSPTHTFGVGNYNIVLTIVTSAGCTDTVTYVNGIRAGVRPNAAFSATPTTTCAETPVTFTDLTTPGGSANQWYWDFGDGGTSTLQNPRHTYGDTGVFDVMLIALNNGCPDTLIIPQYITIAPPIAAFTFSGNCTNRLVKTFTNQSIGADSWLWEFGDGTTSTEENPVHTYATSGSFQVKLTVYNNQTGCDDDKIQNVIAVDEIGDIAASDTVICRGSSIVFEAANITPTLYNVINWNFGNGVSGNGTPITAIYYNAGIYNVRLITRDRNGCRDTIIKPQFIKVNGPNAAFGASTTNICSSNIVNFTDSSVSDGRNNIVQWIWNYGDGQIDTLNHGNTAHVYTTGGSFTISLTAVDNSGCSNTATRANLVNVFHPVASFNTYDTLSCPGRNVTFNNTSTGSGLTYTWNFGDGTTSTEVSPQHPYNTNGVFNIRLSVVDQNGCRDSVTQTAMVRIVSPMARFTVSDTLGTCPPLIVNFTNNSVNATNMVWNFGDNTSSTTLNPSHFYAVSGVFQAKLTVTGPGGCTSVRTKTITVRGPRGTISYGPLSGCVPTAVNITANTVSTNSYIWDFNDGSTNNTTATSQSHVYSRSGNFVPSVILRDTAGCLVPVVGTDTIRIHDVRADFTFNNLAQCDRGVINFNNTSAGSEPITSYLWNFGDGNTSTAANPSYQYNSSGSYHPQLITTTLHGCKDTLVSTLPVNIVASPQAVIGQTANGCVNLSVRFNASLAVADTSAINWQWNFGNNNTSTVAAPPTQQYNIAGSYPIQLIAINSSGCRDTATSTVEAYAIPNIDAGRDTMICKGTGRTLQATGGATYQWSPSTGLSCTNCANPIANPASAITYHVTGTSIHGCSSSDSVQVSVKFPFQMNSSSRDTICTGSSVRLTAGGAYAYSWSPAAGLDNPNASSPLASPTTTTLYQVIGTDDKNCFKDTAYVPIVVYNYPTVEAGQDRTINVGQTINLVPQISADVTSVRWSPTGPIFRDIYPGITVKPRETTVFTVTVSNKGGCTTNDQLTVNVLCNGANLFIPNTFSPNGDGMNDIFYPRGSGVFTIKRIKIFSRWGDIVFERNNFNANDASKGWDGKLKGKDLNPDVFVYMVEVICDNNETLTFKGNVALIK